MGEQEVLQSDQTEARVGVSSAHLLVTLDARAAESRTRTVQSRLLQSFCQLQVALKIDRFCEAFAAMCTLEAMHCPEERPLECRCNPLESSEDSPQTRVRRDGATAHNSESQATGVQVHLKPLLSPLSLKLS